MNGREGRSPRMHQHVWRHIDWPDMRGTLSGASSEEARCLWHASHSYLLERPSPLLVGPFRVHSRRSGRKSYSAHNGDGLIYNAAAFYLRGDHTKIAHEAIVVCKTAWGEHPRSILPL